MIKIQDFDTSHLERAQAIALENYKEERSHVPNVPPLARTLDLLPLAQNGLGVAAFAKGKLVGFLCSVLPFSNAFRSTDAVGVFSLWVWDAYCGCNSYAGGNTYIGY